MTKITPRSVADKFNDIELLVDDIATFGYNSKKLIFLYGLGGVGKTHTVEAVLADKGMTRIVETEEVSLEAWSQYLLDMNKKSPMGCLVARVATLAFFGLPYALITKKQLAETPAYKKMFRTPQEKAWDYYFMVSGAETPVAVFNTLALFGDNLIIWDDCDKILMNPETVEILKGASDSKEDRYVTHGNFKKKRTKKVEGRFIIITNKDLDWLEKHCQPLLSRAVAIDASMTPDEIIVRMKEIGFTPHYLIKHRLNADAVAKSIAYMETRKDELADLSLRTLAQIADVVHKHGDDIGRLDNMFCRKYVR